MALSFSEIIIISILVLTAVAVYLHAKKQGLGGLAFLWALVALILGPLGVLAYIIYVSYANSRR